jgi:hypothetical protein
VGCGGSSSSFIPDKYKSLFEVPNAIRGVDYTASNKENV